MQRYIATFALALLAGTAAFPAEPRAERAPYNSFTDQEETAIGNALAKKFEQKNKIVRNPIAELYLENIVEQLAARSQRPEVRYQVRILNSNAVNGFSLPGAHIYVTMGLLDFVDSESEMVSVLSHEVGHVVGRHMMNRIARMSIVEGVLSKLRSAGIPISEESADSIAGASINIVYTLFERSFNRDEEREADLFGFYQMARARWHPNGMITLLEHIQRGSKRYGTAEKLFASHPEASERSERLRAEMGEVMLPRDLKSDSFQFQVMKRALPLLR